MYDQDLADKLLNIASCKMLIELLSDGDHYVASITKNTGLNYSHVFKSLQYYEEYGLVESSKEGRERAVVLTPYGRRVARELRAFMSTLDEHPR